MNSQTEKLLVLAFDRAASDPEAVTAFLKARAQMLSDDLNGFNLLRPETSTAPPREVRMPFGKYRSRPLTWIASSDPSYLYWVLDRPNVSVSLKRAIQDTLGL